MKSLKNTVWKGRGGKVIKILGRATGNRHWLIKRMDVKKTKHKHIHEGTLLKYYVPLKGVYGGIEQRFLEVFPEEG